MKKYMSAIAVFAALSIPSFARGPVYGIVDLPVPLFGQQTNSWCWAASGQMVMKYFGVSESQATQATYQFGTKAGVNCADNPTPPACISGGSVEIAHYGFTFSQLGGNSCLTPAQIEDQVYTRDEPWIINPNSPGFGHVLVAVGFINLENIVPNLYFVGINDPWPAVATYNSQGQPTGPVNGDFYWEPYDCYQEGVWEGTKHSEGYDLYNIVPPKTFTAKHPRVMLGGSLDLKQIPKALALRVLQGNADSTKAATDALELASLLVTAESAPKLGFPSVAALKAAHLGKAVEQYTFSTSKLKTRVAARPPSEILEKVPALYFPIEGDPLIHASIRMRKVGDVWKLATFGSPAVSRAWQKLAAAGSKFLVTVESAETAFSGRREGTKLFLSPLFDHPALKLRARVEQRAVDVLPILTDAAKRYVPSTLRAP
ncbi:MAG TPA: papain-like cysteine protease family protein [Fimbriimonadaceae bacterium]|nr:papain-like cysteine protease family protein [Fimbriimonadaceae bacterium]